MSYQFKREQLTADEANRLASACNTHEEKLIIWTLLDTGLRVAELAKLKKENLDWQGQRLMVYGKGGPYGSKSKRRVLPLSARVQPLLEGHFALHANSASACGRSSAWCARSRTARASAGRFRRTSCATRSASRPCRRGSACRRCSASSGTTTWPPPKSI